MQKKSKNVIWKRWYKKLKKKKLSRRRLMKIWILENKYSVTTIKKKEERKTNKTKNLLMREDFSARKKLQMSK